MAGDLLLVGSIPLDTPEQVFRRVGGPLGPYLAYMPDGEVGERRYWIDGIAYRVFNGHPEIETLRRPAPDANGVESWRPLGMHDQFQFRVKPGVTQVRFGDPGWRLRLHERRGRLAFRVPPIAEGRRHSARRAVSSLSAADLQRDRPVLPGPRRPREGGTRRHRRIPRRGRQDGRTDPAAGTGDPVGPRGREPPCRHRAGARGGGSS